MTYTVHLYREMRLVFPGIEAASPEDAARIAAAKGTYDAHDIDDCEGFDHSALVDTEGDENYDQSQVVPLRADGGEITPRPKHVTSRTRAASAEACISVVIQHTGCEHEHALGDLLCDLMHWSTQNKFDFDLALSRAKDQYDDECAEEEIIALTVCAPDLADALHDIKRLASKHGDNDVEPYTLLELIEQKALAVLAKTKGVRQ